jgi:hypothetical protein
MDFPGIPGPSFVFAVRHPIVAHLGSGWSIGRPFFYLAMGISCAWLCLAALTVPLACPAAFD